MTNFKTSPHFLLMNVVNIWFLGGKNFLKKSVKGSETSQVKSFISFCDMFFFSISQNKIYTIRIKKQNVLYDWGDAG